MFENTENPELCPVKAFELYLSKLNPSLDSLWQRPKAFDNFNESDSVWYCHAPLGKNTLGYIYMVNIYTGMSNLAKLV